MSSTQDSPADRGQKSLAEPPSTATDAVLVVSDPVPEGIREVKGLDFNHYAGRAISVTDLVENMKTMGFQASAVGDAVRIINGMVSNPVIINGRKS